MPSATRCPRRQSWRVDAGHRSGSEKTTRSPAAGHPRPCLLYRSIGLCEHLFLNLRPARVDLRPPRSTIRWVQDPVRSGSGQGECDERSTSAGRNAQGRVHPHGGRDAARLDRHAARCSRAGRSTTSRVRRRIPNRLYASQTSGWFGQVIQRSNDGGHDVGAGRQQVRV